LGNDGKFKSWGSLDHWGYAFEGNCETFARTFSFFIPGHEVRSFALLCTFTMMGSFPKTQNNGVNQSCTEPPKL
jgi:hypothetical protein